jgi:chromosome segregation ATPase
MDARRTPERPIPGIPRHTPDPTLERGFVASLRWLVAEGEARGVRRIAVELFALREALTTLDETRQARDEQAARASTLDQERRSALHMLGSATAVDGNGSLIARLQRLRDIIGRDVATRQGVMLERDAWRAMCEFQTQSRAMVHTLLERSERESDALASTVGTLREQVARLERERDTLASTVGTLREQLLLLERERMQSTLLRDQLHTAQAEREAALDVAKRSADELAALRGRLQQWRGTVERALAELRGMAST